MTVVSRFGMGKARPACRAQSVGKVHIRQILCRRLASFRHTQTTEGGEICFFWRHAFWENMGLIIFVKGNPMDRSFYPEAASGAMGANVVTDTSKAVRSWVTPPTTF